SVETRIPCEKEIVLVYEPDVTRGMWKLARIKEINKGKDGKKPIHSAREINRESKQEEPIARRTKSATRNRVSEAAPGEPIMKRLFLLAMISILTINAKTMEDCKWISGSHSVFLTNGIVKKSQNKISHKLRLPCIREPMCEHLQYDVTTLPERYARKLFSDCRYP
ncbi:unnamed protein product, partial [Onchocerca ochengi]